LWLFFIYLCFFNCIFNSPLPTFPWTHLKHSLYTLKLEDNPLVFSPPKIIEASTEAIQTYLEEQLMWHTYSGFNFYTHQHLCGPTTGGIAKKKSPVLVLWMPGCEAILKSNGQSGQDQE
jgi:hypothetical protein